MAYVAMISLQQTINDAVISSCRTPPLSEILESAHDRTSSLLQVLERRKRSSSRLDDLEGQIRDFAHKLEDALELHPSSDHHQLEEEEVEIISFIEFARNMETDYVLELSTPLTEDDDDDGDAALTVSPNTDSGEEMVGHAGLFNTVKDRLLKKMRPDETCFFSVLGEKGSQRTTAAKAVFEDLRAKQSFDCFAWVAVGAKRGVKDILIRVISQVDSLAAADHEGLMSMEKGKLCNYLYGILENRRYMIVLDDVCHLEVLLYMRRSLPDEGNGSLVILTTNIDTIAQSCDDSIGLNVPAHYFERFVWYALRLIMFGPRFISSELEEAAKKIIRNCRCLYISAAKTFLFLLKLKTVEQWMEIAADERHPIFAVVDEISEIRKIKEEIQLCNWGLDGEIKEAIVCTISMFINISSCTESIKKRIQPERFFSKMQVISLLGMSGIGKSTLAAKVFKDESILCYFDHCVWVPLGPKYQTEKILIDILAQIYPNVDKLHMHRDEKLVKDLCEQVSRERCLVVLDNLCSNEPLHYLRNLFPDFKGTTLVTTTLAKVAKFGRDDLDCEIKLLDEEESWRLLSRKLFGGDGLCPPQLEKLGRKIAEKCDGLPLLILTVAEELLEVEMTEENWNDIVSSRQSLVFMNAHRQISKALLPIYQSLPRHLKACFLYMGVFREKYEISTSELIDLWVAEGFLVPYSPQMVEDYVTECLLELVHRSLVMVQHKVSGFGFKTCRLHVVYWHLSNGVASRNKFFHAMNSYEDDCAVESIMDQRIICVRNSILLGMKDVQDSMASNTSAHSLLCVNLFQQYPVPITFDLRSLRVMSAHTIRLYEFPIDVVRQARLRYLSLTSNGKVPTSISNLWKLQYLTLKRYTNIKSSQSSWALPVEIWDMKELKHLQIMGGCLPSHNGGDGLVKLAALLDVSVQCCREEVFDWIPNLKRLSIRIELEPNDKGTSFDSLNNICRLRGLESLKCVVVNPITKYKACSFAPISMFPPNLKKLSLSGLGLSWEHMIFIEECKDLEVLKLKHYAFRGPKWEVGYKFYMLDLKFLLLEDSDLVEWKVNFGPLESLCIKHCYKLRELPIGHFKNIEIVDCSPLCMTWATKEGQNVSHCRANVHASWIARTRGGEVNPARRGPAGWPGFGPFFH